VKAILEIDMQLLIADLLIAVTRETSVRLLSIFYLRGEFQIGEL
jgi:hypothetical protein